MSKVLSWLLWIGLALAALGLVVHAAVLGNRERELISEIAAMRQQLEDVRLTTKRETIAWWDARSCHGAYVRRNVKLRQMMRQCTSRDNFVVREGPRIAWSELSGTDQPSEGDTNEGDTSVGGRVRKIGLYLPAGSHRLHCAVAERLGKPYLSRADGKAPVINQQEARWELGNEAEAYEIQIRWTGGGRPSEIAVLGPDNAAIPAAHPMDLDEPSPGRGAMVRSFATFGSGVAFPSQLQFGEHSWNWPVGNSPPATELAWNQVEVVQLGELNRVEQRFVELRWWIESDAPACVLAADTASWYDTMLLPLTLPTDSDHQQQRQSLAPYQASLKSAFERTFEPYDGSGRFIFRAGAYPALQKSRRADP